MMLSRKNAVKGVLLSRFSRAGELLSLDLNNLILEAARGLGAPHVLFYVLDTYTYNTGPFSGPSNQSEAYFNGTSYIRLTTPISLKKQTGLSFRTCYDPTIL
ncbi:hypothetical protein NQ318_010934 [Aromia moschata]|uniref:Uncharacterized protein n=1 Tax=Aromia moschata TaxID=1265417 RepID=A0AAV8XEJ8_9CUCU|nr:hypothetical protein NQ318_010934 [Aromia moschata]